MAGGLARPISHPFVFTVVMDSNMKAGVVTSPLQLPKQVTGPQAKNGALLHAFNDLCTPPALF